MIVVMSKEKHVKTIWKILIAIREPVLVVVSIVDTLEPVPVDLSVDELVEDPVGFAVDVRVVVVVVLELLGVVLELLGVVLVDVLELELLVVVVVVVVVLVLVVELELLVVVLVEVVVGMGKSSQGI